MLSPYHLELVTAVNEQRYKEQYCEDDLDYCEYYGYLLHNRFKRFGLILGVERIARAGERTHARRGRGLKHNDYYERDRNKHHQNHHDDTNNGERADHPVGNGSRDVIK